MIGSDGSSLRQAARWPTQAHPRSYGNLPRVLGRYARDERVLPLETAVHKMTGFPPRGWVSAIAAVIQPGAKADIVAFSREGVRDLATYEDPHRYAAGNLACPRQRSAPLSGW